MLVAQRRPRNLGAIHAGPLLFGDWGTSRLYVLGLAYSFTGMATPYYLAALGLLMVAVAWAYTAICRNFHEGGGVYTAARQIAPMLGVIGGTLLMADYIVTASLSTFDAFHYIGVPEGEGGWTIFFCCLGTFGVLGVINWFGAQSAGRFALVIAVLALTFSLVIALGAVPFIPDGVRAMKWDTSTPVWTHWGHFVSIILALSGVEAVANMTGIMKEPVDRTARRTIWPVLGEVTVFNLLFGIAIIGLISLAQRGLHAQLHGDDEAIKNAAMRVLAIEVGQHWFGETTGLLFGKVAGIVFGLLLLSATNTVIVDMVAVQYTMGRDGELPRISTRLNYSGVPSLPLVLACLAPGLVLLFVRDLEALGHLYAIGVVGAIAMNVLCCAYNPRLVMSRGMRGGMWGVGLLMAAIWITIAVTKPQASAFAGGLVALALGSRYVARRAGPVEPLPIPARGWLGELQGLDTRTLPTGPRIMVAARGRDNAEFAVDQARKRGAVLFAIYVRTLRVMDIQPGNIPRVEDDPLGAETLGTIAVLAKQAGVALVPIYVTSPHIAEEILDYTVTYGCDTLILGKSRRSLLARKVSGDVVAQVAQHLPEGVSLVARAGRPDAPRDEPQAPAPTGH